VNDGCLTSAPVTGADQACGVVCVELRRFVLSTKANGLMGEINEENEWVEFLLCNSRAQSGCGNPPVMQLEFSIDASSASR
jgi:hypothetical protein